MNCDSEVENRGASIRPTARKNIHVYCDAMGRYGLNSSQHRNLRANSPNHDEHEIDEVDNAFSKMQNVSPLQVRKKNIFRRNSYTQEGEHTEDNSSDDSLPEVSYSAASISNSRLEESDNNVYNINNENAYTHERYERESERQQSNKSHLIVIIFSLIVLCIAGMYYNDPMILELMQNSNHADATQTVHYEVTFENNMNNLQEKYNIDKNLILKLKTGLSTIFSKMDAGSFMFLYNTNNGNFNSMEFDKFTNEVVYTAARYLRNDITSIKNTVVLSSNLNMEEHGQLITRYRDDVDKTGVLLVKEVDSVPSELAMAFHYYCDEYDPLVKRSAIFFTLNLANCSNTADKKTTHDFIEKCLAGKWKTIPPENMRPLLTRVVDIIIDVTNVF